MGQRGRPPKKPVAITGRTLLSLDDAASRLGMSRFTLRDWALRGKVASHKVGTMLKISDAEVERIIAASERPRVVD